MKGVKHEEDVYGGFICIGFVNAMAADCAKGKIEFSKYNGDNTFTVKVDGKEYSTNRGIRSRCYKVHS